MKKKTLLVLLLCMALVVTALTSCGRGGGNGKTAEGEPVPADTTEMTYVTSSDVSDWNYLVETSNTPGMYIDTLVEYDYLGICQPCLAESWERSDDGITWTFHIRKGVKWMTYDKQEYGEDVTANDFVNSCRYILDPANGSQLADMMYTIKGAEEFYNGADHSEAAFAGMVGCRAEDDYTLVYELKAPVPYFLSSTTYKNFMPANKKYQEECGDQWSTDNTTMLYCGEYIMTEYQPQGKVISEANPTYWDADNMYITKITEIYNAEASTVAPQMFMRGEVNYAEIPNEQLDEWLNDPQKSANIRPVRPSFYAYYWQLCFNPRFDAKYEPDNWKIAVNNINFRKSLMYAMNKEAVVKVDDPYNWEDHVSNSVTPENFVAAEGVDFTQVGKLGELNSMNTFDTDKALEYKQKAMEEITAAGGHFPVIIYMPYDTGDTLYTERVQVVEQMLEKNLGTDYIDCQLEGYPDDDFSNNTQRSCNYAMQRCTWMADYLDPLSYTDPFTMGQNRGTCFYMADGYADGKTTDELGVTKDAEGNWPETFTAADGTVYRESNYLTGGYWSDATGTQMYYANSWYDEEVAKCNEEVVDLNKRYEMFADLEYEICYERALIIPVMRGGTGYVASNLLPFESQYAAFGASDSRYKYQHIYNKGISTEEYNLEYEKWQKERAARLKELDDEGKVFGIDY